MGAVIVVSSMLVRLAASWYYRLKIMNIKLTLDRGAKPAPALPRAFGFGKSMGLLSGVICVIALFSLLQLFSTVFISNILRDAKINLVTGDALHRQQAAMDRARLSLLTASDTLNRAGIYYLQDKATGSDGSWHSLLDESLAALQASEQAFARFERLSATAPPAPEWSSRRSVGSAGPIFPRSDSQYVPSAECRVPDIPPEGVSEP